MGLLEKIFGQGRDRGRDAGGWRTFTDLSPSFAPYAGEVYGQELTRAAIERFSTACSKLKPEYLGTSRPNVRAFVEGCPNPTMTWPRFLMRLANVFDADGTAFVVPTYSDPEMRNVNGLWPVKCEYVEVVDVGGEPWARFRMRSGDTLCIEMSQVCVLTKFQLSDDMFGERNCLEQTMRLIDAQNKAQDAAIRNGAKIRFIGRVTGMVKERALKEKRDRFVSDNFGSDNDAGLMLYDTTFADIRQVEPQSYTIDAAEMERIEQGVCSYFGINSKILRNEFSEDVWGAWYESKVEPFAVQLGEGLTQILFTRREMRKNRITFSSNRLEYASNASKRNMVRDMVDRGVFSINEAREILQLPPVPGGDARVIRGEYVNAAAVSSFVGVSGGGGMPKNVSDESGERDLGGDDTFYKDSDAYGRDDFED